MKLVHKALFLCVTVLLSACSNNTPSRLSKDQIDDKSYAVSYGVTGQTYKDRVTANYDIASFTKGVSDWYYGKVNMPIEQIRATTLNRLMDHNVYAYYSGILFAEGFQSNVNHLDANCWGLLDKASMVQGIDDAMHDLQKGQIRDDEYIRKGADDIIHLCVKTIIDDEHKAEQEKPQAKPKKASHKTSKKHK